MFSLRNFIKGGLLSAVGKMEDYQIILNAASWNEKGVLEQDDLIEIQTAIDIHNQPEEPTETESAESEAE